MAWGKLKLFVTERVSGRLLFVKQQSGKNVKQRAITNTRHHHISIYQYLWNTILRYLYYLVLHKGYPSHTLFQEPARKLPTPGT